MILHRIVENDSGIQGVLINGVAIMNTIERPWIPDVNGGKGGTPFLSCIPKGKYECERVYSRKFGDVFVLVNPDLGVYKDKGKGRYRCYLGHVANFPKDVQGCIGLGLKWWPGKTAIQDSKKAVKLFKRMFEDDFTLEIK